jgi:integrase
VTTKAKRAANKKRLTELDRVRKARPGLTWDTKQPGLVLRVRPSGSRSWYTVYSRHGRPRWLALGSAAAIELADARMLAAEAMLAVARGKDPAAEKQAERGAGTFAELHERYLEGYAKKHNKSWQQADALVRRHAIQKWGKLQASGITRGDIKQMMARIAAPITANQALAAVSAIFTWGVREEIVTANPCKLVERNPTQSRERVLADSEVPLFWKALDDVDPTRAAALKMILLTGQRPGEVAHMRREHIVDGWWTMPGVPTETWPGTKNGEAHRVWIPAAAQAVIAALDGKDATGFAFAGLRGGPVTGLDGAMRDVCRALDVDRATPHDLRRTHGSTITALGFGRDAMNRVQNHKEGGITDTYDRHGYAEENKRVMEAVASKIMALVEGRSAKVIPLGR